MSTTLPNYPFPMQQDVALFHRAFGQPDLILTPQSLPQDRIELRLGLIHEEAIVELTQALEENNQPEMIDALIDTIYVSLGGLVEMGAPIDGLNHRSMLSATPGQISRFTLASAVSHSLRAFPNELGSLEFALKSDHSAGQLKRSIRGFTMIAERAHWTLMIAGIDPQPFFDEIQRANMSKLGDDGKPVHSRGLELDGFPAGKVLKGPGYMPPDIARIYRELYLQPSTLQPTVTES